MSHLPKLFRLLVLLMIVALTACAPSTRPVVRTLTSAQLPPPIGLPTFAPTLPKSTPAVQGKFDVGGVNLYIFCLGQGSPAVVLDGGWGEDSSTWLKVMSGLESHTRVCAYDRASLGQSDFQAGERTSQQIAEQLHLLLAKANIESPYLLVGHSLGGMNMLVFADRYPHEVAGVVLVDSAHPDQSDRCLAALPTPAPSESKALIDLRRGLPWRNNQCIPEMMNWPETLAQVRAVKSLGHIPLLVLVAADPTKSSWGDISPELAARLNKVWLDLHKEYLSLSTDNSLILAEHSSHYIQQDEPQVVIDAILKLVEKARQK
jgi:pimeloyl-ACP methyl ester carboxylesterase